LPNTGEKRYIVIVEGGGALAPTQNISTRVEVAGNSCTIAVSKLASTTPYLQWSAIHYIEDNTNTTADIEFISTGTIGAFRSIAFVVYQIIIPSSNTLNVYDSDTDEGTATLTVTLDTPASDSFMFVASEYRNGEDPPALSFTGTAGITTDYRIDTTRNEGSPDENFYAGSKKFDSANTGLTASTTDASADFLQSVISGCVFNLT